MNFPSRLFNDAKDVFKSISHARFVFNERLGSLLSPIAPSLNLYSESFHFRLELWVVPVYECHFIQRYYTICSNVCLIVEHKCGCANDGAHPPLSFRQTIVLSTSGKSPLFFSLFPIQYKKMKRSFADGDTRFRIHVSFE